MVKQKTTRKKAGSTTQIQPPPKKKQTPAAAKSSSTSTNISACGVALENETAEMMVDIVIQENSCEHEQSASEVARAIASLENETAEIMDDLEIQESSCQDGQIGEASEGATVISTSIDNTYLQAKQKSWVWGHFNRFINDRYRCKCKYCPQTFVVSGTGTMSKHLHTKHPEKIPRSKQGTKDSNEKLVTAFRVFQHVQSASVGAKVISTSNDNTIQHEKKKSWVWGHFNRLINDRGRCKCKYCPKVFVVSGTGTMSKHLHTKHPEKIPRSKQGPKDSNGELVAPFRLFQHGQSASVGTKVISTSKDNTFLQAKKKSWVWGHFNRLINDRARCKCKYCPKTFVVSGTGTMSKHLHTKHSEKIPRSKQGTKSSNGELVRVFQHGQSARVGTRAIAALDNDTDNETAEMVDDLEIQESSCQHGQSGEAIEGATGISTLNKNTFLQAKQKSWVWGHFNRFINDRSRCKCKYCLQTFVVSGTGTMSKHLQTKHPEKIPKSKQCIKGLNGELMMPLRFNAEVSHSAFLEFVIINNLPFTIGEEASFQKFCGTLHPLYKPLGGSAVKCKLMETFLQLRFKVIEKLSSSNGAFTTDLWTAPNNMALMAITVNQLDKNFQPIDVIIGFKHLIGEHSGINIANHFYETAKNFELHDRIVSITTDNASSNGTFIDEIIRLTKDSALPFSKDRWIRCFAHVLNFSVKSALEEMTSLIDKLRDLVTSIRASPQRIQKFKKHLNDLGFKEADLEYEEEELVALDAVVIETSDLLPIFDCPTRWSSTYLFLKRALRLRVPIDEIAKDQDLKKNEVLPDEWSILEKVFKFLEHFAIITTYLEGNSYPTLSMVVPLFSKLLDYLEDTAKDANQIQKIAKGAQAGLDELSSYYDKASPIVMVATFLDPRCKMNYFVINGWNSGESQDPFASSGSEDLITTRVRPAIADTWKKYSTSSKIQVEAEGTHSSSSKSPTKQSKRIDSSFIANIISGGPRLCISAEDELKEYENSDLEPSDSDPEDVLLFWASKRKKWPHLCEMARDVLSIPATRAASERAFSTGKDVFGISRMSLNPETVEALVCLRSWYRAGLVNENEVHQFLPEFNP